MQNHSGFRRPFLCFRSFPNNPLQPFLRPRSSSTSLPSPSGGTFSSPSNRESAWGSPGAPSYPNSIARSDICKKYPRRGENRRKKNTNRREVKYIYSISLLIFFALFFARHISNFRLLVRDFQLLGHQLSPRVHPIKYLPRRIHQPWVLSRMGFDTVPQVGIIILRFNQTLSHVPLRAAERQSNGTGNRTHCVAGILGDAVHAIHERKEKAGAG